MTLQQTSRWAIVLIATAASFAALKIAADVFAPIVLGLVLGVVLSPVSTWLCRIGAPNTVGAVAVILVSLTALACILLFLGPAISQLYYKAPLIWFELRVSVRELQNMFQGINEASEDIARMLSPNGQAAEQESAAPIFSLTDALLAAPYFIAQLVIFVGALFFFVLSRQEVYNWIGQKLTKSKVMAMRLEEADRMVSRYFLTISVINIAFGTCVFAVMALIGMPSPILWGVFAALMNFILYLGPALVALGLLVAGIVVFDGVAVVLPPVAFMTLNMIEGQFVTPMLVGRHMSVNPLLVFLSLVFWLWLWGPLGGIIAIPILIWGLAITGQLGHLDKDPKLQEWTGLSRRTAAE